MWKLIKMYLDYRKASMNVPEEKEEESKKKKKVDLEYLDILA